MFDDLGGFDFQSALYAQSPIPIDPALSDTYFSFFAPALSTGFTNADSVYAGLDSMNALASLASGGMVPFAPIASPFPADYAAASSQNLDGLLSMVSGGDVPLF